MTERHPVELHNAFVWDCDDCGRENFVRAVIAELTKEDVDHMIAEYGGDREEWETGRWTTRPDEVSCEHCGAEFVVEEDGSPRKPGT